jgi:hypothetical protein
MNENLDSIIEKLSNQIEEIKIDFQNKIEDIYDALNIVEEDLEKRPATFVFENYKAMCEWFSIEENVRSLDIGATVYLIHGHTNYFWDGEILKSIKDPDSYPYYPPNYVYKTKYDIETIENTDEN